MARLALHAWSLDLTLPDGTLLSVQCPLFVDQAVLYRKMPWWEQAADSLPNLPGDPLPLTDTDPMVEEHGPALGWQSRDTPIPIEVTK
jgi:hypothetical protein